MAGQYTLSDFLAYNTAIQKGLEEQQWDAIRKIRMASCNEESSSFDLIIQANIVPTLISFHEKCELEDLSVDILWILVNLSSGDKKQTSYIVQQGGVEYFISFLDHHSEEIYGQALWGLANIGGESATFRDYLLEKNVLSKTLEVYFLKRGKMEPETRKTVAWLINNLCRSKPAVQFNKIKKCLPYLETSLKDLSLEVVTENLWACAYVTEISEEAVTAVIGEGIMEQVVALLKKHIDDPTITAPALKTCSNVVAENDEITERLIKLDVIPLVVSLMSSPKSTIRKEACYFLSNVAAGSPSQIDSVFDQPEFLPKLLHILKNDESNALNEAVWIVVNSLMGNTPVHARKIINNDIFAPIFQRLKYISKRAQFMVAQAFRELLNHVMEISDTPPLILSLIEYYKENTRESFVKLPDPRLSDIMIDIDNLICDVLDNAQPDQEGNN